jgi:hypothetical protein
VEAVAPPDRPASPLLGSALYDWARFRRAKGAVKLHLLLDNDGYLPSFAVLTEGRTHDLQVVAR